MRNSKEIEYNNFKLRYHIQPIYHIFLLPYFLILNFLILGNLFKSFINIKLE